MDVEGERRPRRPAWLVLAVLLALGLVALASRAHSPTAGSGPSRNLNGELLFEYLMLFCIGLAAIVIPFVGYSFATLARHRSLPPRKNWMVRGLVVVTVLTVVISAFALVRLLRGDAASQSGGAGRSPPASARFDRGDRARPLRFDWVPAAVVGSLFVAGGLIVAGVLRRDRNVRRRSPEALAEQLADVLDETLDDLRAEHDPRRAVIAAYARMERALAWFGLPRRVFEAPLEYLARVLGELRASAESVRRLTELFERAKFSRHTVAAASKDEAIDALVAVRDELRSYR